MKTPVLPVFCALGALLSGALPGHAAIEINGIAAKVNGKVITKKEVAIYVTPRAEILRAQFPRQGATYRAELKKVQDKVLEELIDRKIILTELEDKGARIPDHVVDEEIRKIIRELHNGNEAEFRKGLKAAGMTMRAYRESQREAILVQAFRSQQFGEVAPATPAEIEARYRKRRADLRERSKDVIAFQKIFIPSRNDKRPDASPEENLAFAEELAAKLRNGADFAEQARQHSADAFAEDGGVWPETSRLDLSPAFAQVFFEADVDEVIGPLRNPQGFTIVKILEKKLGPAPPLSKVKERMRKEVEIEKRSARFDRWINIQKRSAMIERRI